MARLFVDTSSEYLVATGVTVNTPVVLACWGRAGVSHPSTALSIGSTGAADYHSLVWNMGASTGPIVAQSKSQQAFSSNVAAGVWHHGCAMFLASNSRRAYANGGNVGTNTGTQAAAVNQSKIGVSADSTPANYMDGSLAECGIWDLSVWPGATISLQADAFRDIALAGLAAGFSPLSYPLGLVHYWPLGGRYSDNPSNTADADFDYVGGYHMDPGGTPGWDDHPRIIYPNSGIVVGSAGGAALLEFFPWHTREQQSSLIGR